MFSEKNNMANKKEKKTQKIQFPIDVPGGYYARDYREYKFDKMLRDHANEQGKEAMYEFIAQQDIRNQLRRIDEKLKTLNNINADIDGQGLKMFEHDYLLEGNETQAD